MLNQKKIIIYITIRRYNSDLITRDQHTEE